MSRTTYLWVGITVVGALLATAVSLCAVYRSVIQNVVHPIEVRTMEQWAAHYQQSVYAQHAATVASIVSAGPDEAALQSYATQYQVRDWLHDTQVFLQSMHAARATLYLPYGVRVAQVAPSDTTWLPDAPRSFWMRWWEAWAYGAYDAYSIVDCVRMAATDRAPLFHHSYAVRHRSDGGAAYPIGFSGWYMPIFSQDGTRTIAVLELMYPSSDLNTQIQNVLWYAGSGMALTLGCMIVWLGWKSWRGEQWVRTQMDVTNALMRAKEQAEMESSEKSQFLANVSHELRTPLNSIIGFSDLMKQEQLGPLGCDTYREYAQDINASGAHLLGLINDILDYSKANAGKLTIEHQEFDAGKIVRTTIRMMNSRAEEAGVALHVELPDEHVILRADPKRFRQVLLNLLSNGIKFTPQKGVIVVRAFHDASRHHLVFQVQDTGIGIAPKDLARAMSSFGQVDNELSRKYEGTGLGLPLTKKLVELMQGRFEIESLEGAGTTITLRFPSLHHAKQEIF